MIVFLFLKILLLVSNNKSILVVSQIQRQQKQCFNEQPIIEWTNDNDSNNGNSSTSSIYKEVYQVGVLAIRGFEAAYAEFNSTFSDYLTETAGKKFNPPLKFEMKPLNFILLFDDTEQKQVDFFYVNPSAYSCIESEYGAQSLASQISRRKVSGNIYHLTQFGGVIFTLKNQTSINTVKDIKGHSTAAASVNGLGSGQMQARELIKNGLSYMNDPSQVVYTSNQGKVVHGVLNGDFDVGFVRTDQIERTVDANGIPIDTNLFKIIEPKAELEIDGMPFPFESSTPLYPEWNIAALTHIPNEVSLAVQEAMYNLENLAIIGQQIDNCYEEKNCTSAIFEKTQEQCKLSCHNYDVMSLINNIDEEQCDVNDDDTIQQQIDLSLLAHKARSEGKYTGWRSTLSYMELRNMQEETDFIEHNAQTGAMQCVRSKRIYDAITCPPGHFKKSEDEVLNGCINAGLPCREGYQCLCKPCVKAFDVNVYPIYDLNTQIEEPCGKFTVCGELQQLKVLHFLAVDNKQRENLQLSVLLHEQDMPYEIIATPSPDVNYTYSFSITATKVGTIIMEVFVGDEQIPESPFRVAVEPRDCALDMNDDLRVPNEEGSCVCQANSVQISNNCIAISTLLSSIMVPLAIISIVLTYFYVQRKRAQADSIWAVKVDELHFRDPAVIIGRGTFGLVLLAEYRGTLVAVKRVIPPKVTPITRHESLKNLLGNAESAAKSMIASSNYHRRGKRDSSTSSPTVEDMDAHINQQGSSGVLTSLDVLEPEIVGPTAEIDVPNSRRASVSTMGSKQSADADNNGINKQQNLKSSFSYWNDVEGDMEAGKIEAPVASSTTKTDGGMKSGFHGLSSMSGSLSSLASGSGSFSASWMNSFEKRKPSMFQKDEYSRLKADFIIEMRHLSKLRHPCITTVMGAVIDKKEEPMLVMEYMELGSLYDLLHNETMILDGEFLLPILKDIAQGVRFLHTAVPQVIHGDLKAQNVLVDSKFRAKVADFGLSQKKKVGATGTPYWMAPELLRGESENTSSSDVYSFGIILYEVYSRKHPYEGENYKDVMKLISDPVVNKRPPVPPSCPPLVASIMKECLMNEASKRPSFEELDQRLKRLDPSTVEPGKMIMSLQQKKAERDCLTATSAMIYESFPKHVADAIIAGRKVEAESFPVVTIFFSDIVGFTTISSMITPTKVSDMLDRLYLAFDALSDKYEIFKIETIGDAYMSVTNLMKPQPDHAKRITLFAIEAIEVASITPVDLDDETMGTVNIRVGFHSGPVVASVVGSRNLKYSIFGDTVNTASRMESNSKPGRIQCSDIAANYLRKQDPTIPLKRRCPIEVKGKGIMQTFWVNESDKNNSTDVNSNASSKITVPQTNSTTTTENKKNIKTAPYIPPLAPLCEGANETSNSNFHSTGSITNLL